MARRTIFVTGTDTGVGKTVASAALAADLAQGDDSVCYFKPVQTGLAPREFGDAQYVAQVAGVRAEEGVRFRAPLAPTVAAAAEDSKVDLDALLAQVSALSAECEILIVEGAGGLLVPLADTVDMADFAIRIGAELIVVTRPALGTLNHTALTVEAARRRGLAPSLVVSNWPADPGITETTNLEQLRDMAPAIGLVPAVTGLDVEGEVIPEAPRIVSA